MADYEFNLPVHSEQLEAIGMVACEWAYLESVIEVAIWNLAGIYDEETGMSITTHLGMPARLDMMLTLFHQRHGDCDEYTRLKKFCENIRRKLSPARGSVVHQRWVEGEFGSPRQFVVIARGKLVRDKIGRPASQIREIAHQIADQSKSLQRFLQPYGA